MSTTASPDRRFIVALIAAVASTTLALGATAGALLGWIGPAPRPGEPSSPASAGPGSALVYVPIAPSAPPAPPGIDTATVAEPPLAVAGAGSRRDDRREHDRDHDEGDDD